MGNRFSIPTGAIPPDQLEEALKTLTQKTAEQLAVHQPGFRVTFGIVQAQHEATGKSDQVLPKFFHNQIKMRECFARGINVDVIWRRRDPENVSIAVDTRSTFEDALFYGLIGLAGVLAFVSPFMIPSIRVVSDLMMFAFFLAYFALVQIPYFVIRRLMRASNRCLLEEVATLVRETFIRDPQSAPR